MRRRHAQLAWLKQRRLAGARRWEEAEAEVPKRTFAEWLRSLAHLVAAFSLAIADTGWRLVTFATFRLAWVYTGVGEY